MGAGLHPAGVMMALIARRSRGMKKAPVGVAYTVGGQRVVLCGDDRVYPPSEDSLLLASGLGRMELRGRKVLELGTGAGLAGILCALRGAEVVCTDINPHAARLARKNAKKNGVGARVEVVMTNLFDGISGRFDLVLFNPPHLPTEEGDLTRDPWLDASVCGGPDGLEVARRFLGGLPAHLAMGGQALLVLSLRPGAVPPPAPGLGMRKLRSRRLDFEELALFEVKADVRPSRRAGRGDQQRPVVSRVHRSER